MGFIQGVRCPGASLSFIKPGAQRATATSLSEDRAPFELGGKIRLVPPRGPLPTPDIWCRGPGICISISGVIKRSMWCLSVPSSGFSMWCLFVQSSGFSMLCLSVPPSGFSIWCLSVPLSGLSMWYSCLPYLAIFTPVMRWGGEAGSLLGDVGWAGDGWRSACDEQEGVLRHACAHTARVCACA